jgi:hypothetical protein
MSPLHLVRFCRLESKDVRNHRILKENGTQNALAIKTLEMS